MFVKCIGKPFFVQVTKGFGFPVTSQENSIGFPEVTFMLISCSEYSISFGGPRIYDFF